MVRSLRTDRLCGSEGSPFTQALVQDLTLLGYNVSTGPSVIAARVKPR